MKNIFLFPLKFELKRIIKWDPKKEEWIEVVIKHEIRFLDSFKFTLSGLNGLVKNLSREDLKETARFFGEKIDLVSRKGVYPYEFMDDSSIDRPLFTGAVAALSDPCQEMEKKTKAKLPVQMSVS